MTENRPAPAPSRSVADDLFEAAFRLVGFLAISAVRLAWWAVLFPMLGAPAVLVAWVWAVHGWEYGTGALAASLAALSAWLFAHPRSFHRAVTHRVRGRWRRHYRYVRPWANLCEMHGLTSVLDGSRIVPRLARVRTGLHSDALTVAMLPGQSPADWAGEAEALAHSLRVEDVTVGSPRRGTVVLTVHHRDSLAAPVPLPPTGPDAAVDLRAIPVGRTEDGAPWKVPVLGNHVLIAGATGAGKGSVIWSLLAGLAPAIRTGHAAAWVIDPKGGMELGAGQPMFARFAHTTGEPALELLRDAAATLTERAARLRGVTRLHTPTPEEPLIVIVVDEIASLTAYTADRKHRAEAEALLGLILTQGRAVGVSVVAAVQDPSKDVLAFRQLFPTRIGLRLTEPSQAAMALGPGARDNGAPCETIPAATPGVGYVATDGSTGHVRVRAYQVTDTDVAHIVTTATPNTPTAAPSPAANRQS